MPDKAFRDNSGMTLIEIMMAIAVFGLIIIMFTSAVSGYYRVNNGNLEYTRMAELARAELEKIKAGAAGSLPDATPFDAYYPPGSTPANAEQVYTAIYANEVISDAGYPNPTGQFVKIAVAPRGSSNPFTDPEGYVLVSWLPSTAVDPHPEGSVPQAPAQPYVPGNWVDIGTNPYNQQYWDVSEDGITRSTVGGTGHGLEDTTNYIFYNYPFKTFDYTTYSTFSDISNNNTGTGLAIKKDTDLYVFYMTNGGGTNRNNPPIITLNFAKNTSAENPGDLPDTFPYNTGVILRSADLYSPAETYYLRAIGAPDGTLTLSFGIYNPGDVENPHAEKFTIAFPAPYFDPTSNHMVGLFDETSGSTNSTFRLPSNPGDNSDCNLN